MIRLTITERGGAPKQFTFPKDDITIGRSQGNDVILPRNNISKRHTRVLRHGGALVVRDLESTNGTFLNGKRIRGDEKLQAGDRIFLADFVLIIEEDESAATPAPPEAKRVAGPPPLPTEKPAAKPPALPGSADDDLSAMPLGPGDLESVAAEPEEEAEPVEALEPLGGDDDESEKTPASKQPVRKLREAEQARRPEPGAPKRREPEPEPEPPRKASEARDRRMPTRPSAESSRPVEPSRPAEPPRPTIPPRPLVEAPPPEAPAPRTVRPKPAVEATPRPAEPIEERKSVAPRRAPKADVAALAEDEVRRRVLARIGQVVPLDTTEPTLLGDPDLQGRIKSAVMDELFSLESQDLLAPSLDRDAFVARLAGSIFGLGPLPEAVADAATETLCVYPDGSVFRRRGGKWSRDAAKMDAPLLPLLCRRLASSAGAERRGGIVESFRATHPDLPGVQVMGVCGGSVMRGAFLRIERPATFPEDLDRLADAGVLSVPMGTFLRMCVEGRQTVAVVGPKGSPRAALLRALVAALPPDERVLWLSAPGSAPPPARAVVVPMSAPSPGESMLDDTDDSPARLLEAVRWMSPGLVVVEAVDAARDAALIDLVRTRMGAVLMGVEAERYEAAGLGAAAGPRTSVPPPGAPGSAPDLRLARLVDVVAEVGTLLDGTHRVRRIAERSTDDGDPGALTAIFEFVLFGAGETGELIGEFRPTRAIPRFLERRRQRGKRVDVSIFQ